MLHWAFPPVVGGVETHLLLLGPELVKRKLQVDLLVGSHDGRREEFVCEGMRVRRTPLLDLNSMTLEEMKLRLPEIKREIEAFLEWSQPDLIHAHNMHYFSPVHTKILCDFKEKLGVPLLLTAHNVWNDSLWSEMLQFATKWDGIIAVSRYIKKELVASGYPEEKIAVVHHGIDLKRFRPGDQMVKLKAREHFPELKGRKVIFHPARMSFAKGSHLAVKALHEVKKVVPEVLLVLTGTENTVDWDRARDQQIRDILALIEDLQLQEHVFIRFFSWQAMPRIYQAADVCIYPSCFEEPFGIAVIEAMASGRPIIVSKAGGMPEIVEDQVSGLIVEKGNYHDLAEKLIAVLTDQGLAERLVANGLRRVRKEFTKQKMVEKTLNFYNRFLVRKSGLPGVA